MTDAFGRGGGGGMSGHDARHVGRAPDPRLCTARAAAIILAVVAVVEPRVVELSNLKQVVIQASPIAILALGAMVVLLTGGIDLSAGFGVAMMAVAMVGSMGIEGDLTHGLLVALCFGLALGLVNGRAGRRLAHPGVHRDARDLHRRAGGHADQGQERHA